MARDPDLNLRNRFVAGLLAWLVPGLGHVYQGRFAKAILFAVCIHGLFWTGFALGDFKVVWFRWDNTEKTWAYLAQVGVGAATLPALWNDPAQRAWLPEPIRGFELPPASEEVLNELHLRLGKLADVAVIYTIIAGLLNYFVIYDALAGPAMREEELREIEERRKARLPEPATV
jgi:TM2 domain-containing membrane protein YozV